MVKASFAHIEASMPNFNGEMEALPLKDTLYELIIGNISETRASDYLDETWCVKAVAVTKATTRLSTKTEL